MRTNTIYSVGHFSGYQIAIRCAEQGNYKMAVEVERAIEYFSPQIVMLVGIAGSRKKAKVTIGDVVIVTRVYAYASGKEAKKGFLSRDIGGPMNHFLLEEAKDWARKQEWQDLTSHQLKKYKAVPGAIASGESVVVYSKSRTARLIERNSEDTIAVEMEGVGLSVALHALENVRGINIRGISDLLDGKDEDYDNGDRELAAENASAFAFYLISRLGLEPVKKTSGNIDDPPGQGDHPGNTYNIQGDYIEQDNSKNIHIERGDYYENYGIVNIGQKKKSQID
ncbi:MAG: hypothetical protein AAF705_01530 [Bacteroidota bacterium]